MQNPGSQPPRDQSGRPPTWVPRSPAEGVPSADPRSSSLDYFVAGGETGEGRGAPAGPPPPAAPRPVTRQAARAAWFEHSVRSWWLLALLFMLAVLVLGFEQYTNASRAVWLFEHGEKVDALIEEVGEFVKRPNFVRQVDDPWPVTFSFTTNDQKVHRLRTKPNELTYTVHPLQKVPLHVDPADPDNRFTFRTTKPSAMGIELSIPLAFLTVALFFFAISWVLRRRVLATWKDGMALEAVVIEIRRAATAPLSQHLRCIVGAQGSGNVIDVLIPKRLAILQPGDALWLVLKRRGSARALPAMRYQ